MFFSIFVPTLHKKILFFKLCQYFQHNLALSDRWDCQGKKTISNLDCIFFAYAISKSITHSPLCVNINILCNDLSFGAIPNGLFCMVKDLQLCTEEVHGCT